MTLFACSGEPAERGHEDAHTGPNGGRVLLAGDFELELAIFERGTPAELRAWARDAGTPVAPADVSLTVELTRLGGRVDRITFEPGEAFLRGKPVVEEPHSFEVSVEASHAGTTHTWAYESFEGRTRIDPEVAEGLGLATAVAGPIVLTETVQVHGRVHPVPERTREIRARFDGMVREVVPGVGSAVRKGDLLATVESDESLRVYRVLAPISGVVTQRDANPGEHTAGRRLLTITDASEVQVELSIFPRDRSVVQPGSAVAVAPATGGEPIEGEVSTVDVVAGADQAVVARVRVKDPQRRLPPGSFVRAAVTVEEHPVPLAVKTSALQTFRGFDVVYARVGDVYEVRMLELGHQGEGWVEVLSGLEPGTRYVTENSHLIKADLGSASAEHHH